MLLEGATSEMKDRFKLRPAGDYMYLSDETGIVGTVDGRSDSDEFSALLYSMRRLAFDAHTQVTKA